MAKSKPGTPSGLAPPTHHGLGPVLTLVLLAWLAFPAAFSVTLAWFMLQATLANTLSIVPLP